MSKTNINTANSLPASINSRLKEAENLLQAGEDDAAIKTASAVLDEIGPEPRTLLIMCTGFYRLGRFGLAQLAGMEAVRLAPYMHETWGNLGAVMMQRYDSEAIGCLEKSLQIKPDYYHAAINLATAYQHDNKPLESIDQAEKASLLNPEDYAAAEVIGFSSLMLHRWATGWQHYNMGMGMHSDRTIRCYGASDVPVWNGLKGQTVVLYGEQGIGDEICFAQYVPEMMKDVNLIVETCQTHYELFKSSFDCPVYPTRYVDNPDWVKDHKIDAKMSFSQGMQYYRSRNEKFSGKPFLKASEEKRKWWRAILEQYPGKKIGIAWNAGITETGKVRRALEIDDLLPIFKGMDATFVCLEYKDVSKDLERLKEHGVELLDFGVFINGHKNYGDTAALVSELDHVIAPTTAVVDLCGGLGQSCDVFVPEKPFWRYCGTNCWYNSVNYVHQKGSWLETVESYMEETCQIA